MERAPGQDRSARIGWLKANARATPLLLQLSAYDEVQLRFHQVHLALASQQLKKVGVSVGTGGTTYRDYLERYAQEQAPLFPGL